MQTSSTSPRTAGGDGEHWRLSRGELIAIFGFWTFFAVLISANRLLDPRFPVQSLGQALSPASVAFLESYLWAALTPLIFWLASRSQRERAGRVGWLLLLSGVGMAVAIAVDLSGDLLRQHVVQTPSRHGLDLSPLRSIARLWFINDLVVYVGVLAAGFAREYFVRYRVRQAQATRLEAHAAHLQAQLADARLETLRMQLNPHFLFNTLHAISSLVERDPRGVRRMIARLSELLRYTLNGSGEQEIPVEQELEFLQRYLEIMQIRFQGRLDVAMHVEPAAQEALLPNLILQPLVENAVKHGVSNKIGPGRIEVHARRQGDQLVVEVRDDGPGLPPGDAAPPAEGVGLRNVRERLEELYGDDARLVLRTGEEQGAVATIEVPFHTRADLRSAGVPDSALAGTHGD